MIKQLLSKALSPYRTFIIYNKNINHLCVFFIVLYHRRIIINALKTVSVTVLYKILINKLLNIELLRPFTEILKLNTYVHVEVIVFVKIKYCTNCENRNSSIH